MTTIDTPAPDDTTFSIDDWISGATRPETVIMLSSKGHEYGQFKSLEVELLAAQKAANDETDQRLTSGVEPRRIAAEMEVLRQSIDAGRHPFHLRGLSESDLKAIREATKDLDEDATNEHLLAKCCIEPVLTPAKWAALREAIGEGQWLSAIRAANQVSFEGSVDAPFCLAASVILATAKS